MSISISSPDSVALRMAPLNEHGDKTPTEFPKCVIPRLVSKFDDGDTTRALACVSRSFNTVLKEHSEPLVRGVRSSATAKKTVSQTIAQARWIVRHFGGVIEPEFWKKTMESSSDPWLKFLPYSIDSALPRFHRLRAEKIDPDRAILGVKPENPMIPSWESAKAMWTFFYEVSLQHLNVSDLVSVVSGICNHWIADTTERKDVKAFAKAMKQLELLQPNLAIPLLDGMINQRSLCFDPINGAFKNLITRLQKVHRELAARGRTHLSPAELQKLSEISARMDRLPCFRI